MAGSNQFSIGQQSQLTIVGAAGPMTFNILTEFDAKPQYKKLQSEGLDGVTRFRNLPAGHTGAFKLDRSDSSASDYFAQQEANFFSGLNPDTVTITQTIVEASGAITQYQYLGVTLALEDDGDWKGLDKVVQTIGFSASRKIKLS